MNPGADLYQKLLNAAALGLYYDKNEHRLCKPIRRVKHASGLSGRQWKRLVKRSRAAWRTAQRPSAATDAICGAASVPTPLTSA